MLFAFAVTFREAVEVGLIMAIILSYLRKLGKPELVKHMYYGLVAGFLLSVALAGILFSIYTPETAIIAGAPTSAIAFFAALIILSYMMKKYMNLGLTPLFMIGIAVALMFAGLYGYASTQAIEALEAGALFSATIVLTYVVVWMAQVAYRLKEKIVSKIDLSITTGKVLGILSLTAAAVLREGAETALLLTPAMLASPADTLLGATLGVLAACAISYVYITRSVRLNWRKFFLYTSLLLITFSSGILKIGVQDMVSLGLMPPIVPRFYDASAWVPEEGILGGLLYVFVGYTENAPLLPLITQLGYLIFAIGMVFRVYHVNLQLQLLSRHSKESGKATLPIPAPIR